MSLRDELDINRIIELYYGEKCSLKEVGEELGCSGGVIGVVMDDHGVERRSPGRSYDTMDNKPKPRFYVNNGYTRVECTVAKGENESFLLHRLTAVAWYGYDEVVDKHVHHENGVPWDNRKGNIEPIDRREHMLRHLAGDF